MNPDFDCCNSVILSWVDKATTGTWSFVSVIGNAVPWFLAILDKTLFTGQVRMILISQLIDDILKVIQKLLKYFNGAIIWTTFVSLFPVEPVIFCFSLAQA